MLASKPHCPSYTQVASNNAVRPKGSHEILLVWRDKSGNEQHPQFNSKSPSDHRGDEGTAKAQLCLPTTRTIRLYRAHTMYQDDSFDCGAQSGELHDLMCYKSVNQLFIVDRGRNYALSQHLNQFHKTTRDSRHGRNTDTFRF